MAWNEARLTKDFFIHYLRSSQVNDIGIKHVEPETDVINLDIQDQFHRAESHDELGNLFLKIGDLANAEKQLELALQIRKDLLEESRDKDSELAVATSNFHLGLLKARQGRFDEAVELYYDPSLIVFEKYNDPLAPAVQFHRCSALVYGKTTRDKDKHIKTLEEVDKTLEALEEKWDDPQDLAILKLNRAGFKYFLMQRHEKEGETISIALRAMKTKDLLEESREQIALITDPVDPAVNSTLELYDVFLKLHTGKATDDELWEEARKILDATRRAVGNDNPRYLDLELKVARAFNEKQFTDKKLERFDSKPPRSLSQGIWARTPLYFFGV